MYVKGKNDDKLGKLFRVGGTSDWKLYLENNNEEEDILSLTLYSGDLQSG